MKKFINSKYFYLLISLLIAIWLFLSVSSPNMTATRDTYTQSKQTSDSATKTVTIKDVKLNVNIDTDRYYVTGYPQTVEVTIKGPSSLVTATQNTRNFNVYADLTNYGVGNYRIKLKVNHLNSNLHYSVSPSYVKVNIQQKSTRVMPIQVGFDKNKIAKNYTYDTPQISPDTVTVSGSKKEVSRITQVVAKVNLPKGIKEDYDREVLMEPLDSNGKIVNAVLKPQTTHITIPIHLPSKTVKVNLKETGNTSGKEYNLSTKTDSIKIYGNKEYLESLDNSVDVPVDVSDVDKKSTTKTIDLKKVLGKKVTKTYPKTIKVKIEEK